MKRLFTFLISMMLAFSSFAIGEASTLFGIFVPPNNDPVGRDVCLIVTAVYDNTEFEIIDDNSDGDDDDSVSGVLMAGQSYVLYIRENGVNDDAPHGGEAPSKQDGDYFTVTANKLIFASQSTKSDWQHDWLPSTNKKSKGQRFIIYSPPTSYSNRDLNVLAFENNTHVTIKKVSTENTPNSGYTSVDLSKGKIVANRKLDIGEDIIYHFQNGRDIMETGATYLIESDKDITVQYGALWGNARDGGGYVPSDNGSTSGELFYFTVPYEAPFEQEIRIVSWDDNNEVILEKYDNGTWENVDNWNINRLETGDWVSHEDIVSATFRVRCTAGKKVSVFEANWLETGSPGTSDISTMLSAENGTAAGKDFIAYMAPPGHEENVTDPFTGNKMTSLTHLYIFGLEDAVVTVKDAETNGSVINRTYNIVANRYVDCSLDLDEWKSISGYHEDTKTTKHPYLVVKSDKPIAVLCTNFNDNWMNYYGSTLPQAFKLTSEVDKTPAIPGDTVTIISNVVFIENATIENPDPIVWSGDGCEMISSKFIDITNNTTVEGVISPNPSTLQQKANFENIPDLLHTNSYQIETKVVINVNYSDGYKIPDGAVIAIENTLSGKVGAFNQQAAVSSGISCATGDIPNLMFTQIQNSSQLLNQIGNTWGVSFADINNDSYPDIFIPNYNQDEPNNLYVNNGDGTFTKVDAGDLTEDLASSVAASWGDYDNDGHIDLYVANNLGKENYLYRNLGNGTFEKVEKSGGAITTDKGYSHGCTWADIDNDGDLDMFVTDYFPSGFNKLYRNNGDGTFDNIESSVVTNEASHSIGGAWADYDNDGDLDLFVPNDKAQKNSFYVNNGGVFEKKIIPVLDQENLNTTSASWADYDNDGNMDLFITNASNRNNCLYRNDGNGGFDIVNQPMSNDAGHSHGSVWQDFDNDGNIDLYVTNDQGQSNCLYMNNGDGTFKRTYNEPVSSAGGNSFGTSAADIDDDGDMDLLVGNHTGQKNCLYKNNNKFKNNWVKIKLIGREANTSAIGAKVRIKMKAPNGSYIWQVKEITSQNNNMLHFGLGKATIVDEVVIEWPSGYVQKEKKLKINQTHVFKEPTGSYISGTVYIDQNSNCHFEEGEPVVPNIAVRVGDKVVYTDEKGEYFIYLKKGKHTVEVMPHEGITPTCDLTDYKVHIKQLNQTYNGFDFPNLTDCLSADLEVSLGLTALRAGFKNNMSLGVINKGVAPATNVQLILTVDRDIIPVESSLNWDNVVENGTDVIYTWNLGTVGVGESIGIAVIDSVSLNAAIGELKITSLQVISSEEDCSPQDNIVYDYSEITGAVDPNDKLVYPKGVVNLTDTLHYKIRFQNVGNRTADQVIIIDTLSRFLDIATFKPVAMSHKGNVDLSSDGILTWTFDNINLPDSASNEEASNGFVSFSILPRENAANEQITNKAYIQFDYNNYIITNEVANYVAGNSTIGNSEDVKVQVLPNPVSDEAKIIIYNPKGEAVMVYLSKLNVYDLSGRLCYTEENIQSESVRINSEKLKSGIYFIEIITPEGGKYRGKFSVIK